MKYCSCGGKSWASYGRIGNIPGIQLMRREEGLLKNARMWDG